MPYCQECGKKVAANAKFCRNCGASQIEESETVAPVVTPSAPAPEKTKPEPRPKPKAKPRAASKARPEPKPEPEPVLTTISGGNPVVGPDEKICVTSAPGEEETRSLPAQEPVPAEPAITDVTQPNVCPTCDSPLSGDEMVCGVCQAVSAVPPAISELINPPATLTGFAPVPVQTVLAEGRKCRVCGNGIKPGDKFCGKCCAKVIEEKPGAPEQVSSPETSVYPTPSPLTDEPAPELQPAEKSGGRKCRLCGNMIGPGDKFCGRCCAKVVDIQPAVPVTTPANVSPELSPLDTDVQSPVPAPEESSYRKCRLCGTIIVPGARFCSKCCARIADDQPVTAGTAISPEPVITPSYVCSSCGSPANGPEETCGICGSAVVAFSEPSPVPVQVAEKTCGSCGAPLEEYIKFCGSCGTPVDAGSSSVPSPVSLSSTLPGTVSQGGETVMGIIGNAKKMKMLGVSWDTYTLIITDQRMILAKMTQEMINTAIREAQSAAKSEGKGLLSQMMYQMSAMFQYSQRYVTLSPDLALAENKENRGIGNRSISSIKMKIRDTGDNDYREFRILIEAKEGKFEFTIGEDDRFTTLLKQVYGDKVHMPPGYFLTGSRRIKLF